MAKHRPDEDEHPDNNTHKRRKDDEMNISFPEEDVLGFLADDLEDYIPKEDTLFNQMEVACKSGNLELLKALVAQSEEYGLEAKDIVNNRSDIDEERSPSLLHIAAKAGYLPIVKYLCEQGANVNTLYEDNLKVLTPLNSAIYQGHEDITYYLIAQAETDLGLVSEKAFDAPPDLELFVGDEYDMSSTALTAALEVKNLPLIKYLIEVRKVNINEHLDDGYSPFQVAISLNSLEMMQILYQYGADINIWSEGYRIDAFTAAFNSGVSPEVFQFLIEKGVVVTPNLYKYITDFAGSASIEIISVIKAAYVLDLLFSGGDIENNNDHISYLSLYLQGDPEIVGSSPIMAKSLKCRAEQFCTQKIKLIMTTSDSKELQNLLLNIIEVNKILDHTPLANLVKTYTGDTNSSVLTLQTLGLFQIARDTSGLDLKKLPKDLIDKLKEFGFNDNVIVDNSAINKGGSSSGIKDDTHVATMHADGSITYGNYSDFGGEINSELTGALIPHVPDHTG